MKLLFQAFLLLTSACALSGEGAKALDEEQRDEDRTVAGLKYDLLWVEPGTFIMGSPADELLRDKAEGPQTKVTLTKGFWLGRTEVTQSAYEAVTGETPSRFAEVGPNAPVERVSWVGAMAFCKKLTERERAAGRLPDGYVFTLPTEAQWEYAYRAGSTEAYPGDPHAMAWFDENSAKITHPVALREPNAWGFYDMSGNVLEWCLDWYGDYPGGAVSDPSGPREVTFESLEAVVGEWGSRYCAPPPAQAARMSEKTILWDFA